MSTKELLNTLNRYDSRHNRGKLSEIGLKKLLKYRIFQKMNEIKPKSCKKNQ